MDDTLLRAYSFCIDLLCQATKKRKKKRKRWTVNRRRCKLDWRIVNYGHYSFKRNHQGKSIDFVCALIFILFTI